MRTCRQMAPGVRLMGTFGLTEFSADATAAGGKAAPLKIVKATADIETPPETTVHPPGRETAAPPRRGPR